MAERILIVDDDDFMRDSLQLELEAAGYAVMAAKDGMEALECAKEHHFDLVISDVRMPGMDGLATLRAIRETQPTARNMIITGYASPDTPVTALKMKVDDYLMKPFSSEEILQSVRRALKEYRKSADAARGPLSPKSTFITLVSAIFFESRFPYLVGHSERVARLSLKLGTALGFSSQRLKSLYLAALLHDVGSLELPPAVLEKSTFDREDLEAVKSHPRLGHDLLLPFQELKETATIILHHHERWDGSGYPGGIAGDQIPLESRILGLAETYDSLVSERPHRKRCTSQEALQIIEQDPSFEAKLTGVIKSVVARLDGDENLASLKAGDFPEKSLSLVNLADMYRGMGNLDVAMKAYETARNLLSHDESAELSLRIDTGITQVHTAQGRYREALECCRKARQFALERSLTCQASGLAFLETSIRLRCDETEGLEELLQESRATFQVWESSYHVCEADFLLCTLYGRQKEKLADFTSLFPRFLRELFEGRHFEIIARSTDLADVPFLRALEQDLELPLLSQLLAEPESGAIDMLARFLERQNTSVRLKVLDILGKFDDTRARALLSKAQLDDSRLVSEKSSLLLQRTSSSPSAPLLQVFFFGSFRVIAGGKALDDDAWGTRKMRSLFACLASRRGEIRSEDYLMDLFWPQGDEKARHSLHNCISQIRKILAPLLGEDAKKLILKKRDGYTFNKDAFCSLDLEEFDLHYMKGKALYGEGRGEEALKDLQKAERLYTGEFLEGSYDSWSDDLRMKTKHRFLEILRLLGTYFFDKEKYDVSVDYWKKMLGHDNCAEQAYLGLMLCHRALGNSNEAVRIYHECTRTMKKELDLPPSAPVLKAYYSIVHGDPLDMKL